MAQTEAVPTPVSVDAPAPAPELSVVVTLLNEEGSVDELYRRTVAALDAVGQRYELIFIAIRGTLFMYWLSSCSAPASVGEMARVCRRGGVIGVTVTGEDDEDAGQRAAAVVRIAANLGVGATMFDTTAQVSNVETIPVVGVILTR